MARNEEKAQTMLNRWITMKKNEARGPKEHRPFIADECDNLHDAEKWRRELVGELAKLISQIQNENLPHHKLRDLNDLINKKFRERTHWERRIVSLNGPDYSKISHKVSDDSGIQVPGGRGSYRYFGAAKKLPGVAELFRSEPPPPPKRTRYQMYKGVDADYYGYRDDDDGLLGSSEALQEQQVRIEALAAWKDRETTRRKKSMPGQDKLIEESVKSMIESLERPREQQLKAHVKDLPERELLAKVMLELSLIHISEPTRPY
eukprot:TRINITY_DN8798_c0_g1_i6.p1 TRINITY_DN8798_c0_g1~~TRINITY_DN8798_c0_g1_i6.p1  ORF type:complete len:262 (+),score=72.72 TRINITY_DN8798_c0_g1_i6:135-920(+)